LILSLPAAVLLAVVVLGERLTGGQWCGAVLMTAGAFLIALA
jgi:drug/metabolite transporter (DMT)-like permease